MLSLLLALLPAVALVRADVKPTSPGPGDSFNQGEDCTVQWDADTTGKWKKMDVKLMTGSNFDMVELQTILSGTDGTASPGEYSYPCPEVSPYSAIYFYEFTAPGQKTYWTTRFTIASAEGESEDPTEETDGIEWGIGQLGAGGAGGSSTTAGNATDATTATDSMTATSNATSSETTTDSPSDSGADTTTTGGRSTSTQLVTSAGAAAAPTDSDEEGGAQSLQNAGAAVFAGLLAAAAWVL